MSAFAAHSTGLLVLAPGQRVDRDKLGELMPNLTVVEPGVRKVANCPVGSCSGALVEISLPVRPLDPSKEAFVHRWRVCNICGCTA